jgi:hypothetical protein
VIWATVRAFCDTWALWVLLALSVFMLSGCADPAEAMPSAVRGRVVDEWFLVSDVTSHNGVRCVTITSHYGRAAGISCDWEKPLVREFVAP